METPTLSWIPRRHTSTISTPENQTLSLPDGRVLGYAEYGCPTGFPLLFFHGFPSSRLEAWVASNIAGRHRIRVISLDRPGLGLSTFQPHRRITDWPADVQVFARHMGLTRFAVLGGSGGGPYALACALALPPEMLSAVGIMSGAGPWEAGTRDVPTSLWATYLAATCFPSGLRAVTDAAVGLLRRTVGTDLVTGRIGRWLDAVRREKEDVPTAEKGLTIAERRERLLRNGFEGFAQGAEGFVHEARLLKQDWGFRFEDVAFDPIQLWHGAQDKNVSVRMIRYLAGRLPHSVLREFEGEDHFTVINHLEEILSDLIPEGASTERSAGPQKHLLST